MPPRWPRKPDRKDPAFRKLDDRMNFAVHVAIFAACNSGIWFFHNLQQAEWPWAVWVTGGWATILFAHALYIFVLANYSQPTIVTEETTSKSSSG
ncbi:2TM domain-containing protein [Aerosakkonemataceae cyanobacterium BLCC-F154]|uniref:2TM domain-containing protein n=1 Tax=Floridaenema fluviatile BLCC-F154 TaxID=3153640 RepID=A0ABV4Y5M8_9CYAN